MLIEIECTCGAKIIYESIVHQRVDCYQCDRRWHAAPTMIAQDEFGRFHEAKRTQTHPDYMEKVDECPIP